MVGRETTDRTDSADPRASVTKRVHMVPPSPERDAPLGLQEVCPDGGEIHTTPVVLLHGATFGSGMFDIDVPGYSMQNFLAGQGWRNFALDVRGYCRSVPSRTLDAPAEDHPPYARLQDGVEDLLEGIRLVRDLTGVEAVHLVAFSWGTVIACAMAASQPQLLERLVLYAPLYAEVNDLWIDRIADPEDRARINPHLGAYRRVGEADIRTRWDADIPVCSDASVYRDERVLHAIIDALAAADPAASPDGEKSFRAPTGALVDLFEIFNGRPLYDPAAIMSPTLVIRGGDDTTSTASDADNLFEKLGGDENRLATITPGSHFLCAERNATRLFEDIGLFLRGHS